ncbi:transposase [Verrucomicrobiaceae bacterium N1E253]|uniref:Transposase n=1 Tax=Oceaniferula marina TaxID=2748318 RepID=A0A851GK42_9BACT|nr:transposase [Oceaniferula marina]NWK57372.1 transposase [Oceaniferula marina]
MARPIRIEFKGAMYHVMCRGDNGRDIFFGDKGCERFLDTLDEACIRAGWYVHAYVLMGNHYHMLLETPEGNLVDGMKWFQGTYTQRINAWQGRRGHLFQGRYKAQVVNGEQRDHNYFQTVSDYIHLNPARAIMTGKGKRWERLRDYPWSSLQSYCSWRRKRPSWLMVDKVLESYTFKDNTAGREAYAKYMDKRGEEVQGGEPGIGYEELRRGWCLGDGEFRQRMLDKAEKALQSTKRESLTGAAVKEHGEAQAVKLLNEGMEKLDLVPKQLEGMLKLAPEKQVLAAWLSSQTLVGTKWIAEMLHMGHRSNVSASKKWARETKEGSKWLCKLK